MFFEDGTIGNRWERELSRISAMIERQQKCCGGKNHPEHATLVSDRDKLQGWIDGAVEYRARQGAA